MTLPSERCAIGLPERRPDLYTPDGWLRPEAMQDRTMRILFGLIRFRLPGLQEVHRWRAGAVDMQVTLAHAERMPGDNSPWVITHSILPSTLSDSREWLSTGGNPKVLRPKILARERTSTIGEARDAYRQRLRAFFHGQTYPMRRLSRRATTPK